MESLVSPKPVVLKLEWASESPEEPVKPQIAGPSSQDF